MLIYFFLELFCMASSETIIGVNLREKLAEIVKKLDEGEVLKVGFLEGATEESNGQLVSVAMIAAIQNFGAPAVGIPPRPFFSNCIKENSQNWGKLVAATMKSTGYNVHYSLLQAGEVIAAELKESISDIYSPPLSPVTLLLREMKSKGGANFSINGTVVAEARARVKAGEVATGVSTKPLIDSGQMQQAVDYEVSDE